MAKQSNLDPTSAIQAMREEWDRVEDDTQRYALRVRTSAAIKSVVQQVNFDSVNAVFDVILHHGRRVYRFPNLRNVRSKTDDLGVKPTVVDILQSLREAPLKPYADGSASPQMVETFASDRRLAKHQLYKRTGR